MVGRLGRSEAEGQPSQRVKTFGAVRRAWAARWSRRDGGEVSQAEVEKRSEAGEGISFLWW